MIASDIVGVVSGLGCVVALLLLLGLSIRRTFKEASDVVGRWLEDAAAYNNRRDRYMVESLEALKDEREEGEVF